MFVWFDLDKNCYQVVLNVVGFRAGVGTHCCTVAPIVAYLPYYPHVQTWNNPLSKQPVDAADCVTQASDWVFTNQ